MRWVMLYTPTRQGRVGIDPRTSARTLPAAAFLVASVPKRSVRLAELGAGRVGNRAIEVDANDGIAGTR